MENLSLISANFISFEDFSSRMILLPRNDDECTGAKVGSHELPVVNKNECCIDKSLPPSDGDEVNDDNNNDNSEAKEEAGGTDINGTNDVKNHDDKDVNFNTKVEGSEEEMAKVEKSESKDISGNIDDTTDNTKSNIISEDVCTQQIMQVPVGYVLVEIRNDNEQNENKETEAIIPEDLENIEFTDLLSLLREASFPLSLVFAPPNNNDISMDVTKSNIDVGDDSTASSDGALDVEEEESNDDNGSSSTQPLTSLVNKEDAAKYAKQAATELRGRLSTWGYKAATLAVEKANDAAKQVQELRDERQRKVSNDEQQNRDEGKEKDYEQEKGGGKEVNDFIGTVDGTSAQPVVSEEKKEQDDLPVDDHPKPLNANEGGNATTSPEPAMEPCFIFLQTPSGIEQLPNDDMDQKTVPLINNSSVISVRLSAEKACPLGKNGYTFQWYRSYSDIGSTDPNEISTWLLLQGACYAAYQPSMSDVGHRLRCVIKYGPAHQTCLVPSIVSMEQSLFDSAKTTLLGGGQKSITFGNLRGLDDQVQYSLKVDVKRSEDFISESSIFICKVTGDAEDESTNKPIPHYRVDSDPGKPKLFDIICTSHGHLRLQANNRKARESLILALGIANFKGKLSSLTTETCLFPSYETDDSANTMVDSTLGSVDEPPQHDNSYSKLLEAKLAEMNRLLQSKDNDIAKLKNELVTSEAIKVEMKKEVESARQELSRSKAEIEMKDRTIEDMIKQHERAVKSLNNEQSVLQAAIEARDGKIEGLTAQVTELSQRAEKQSEELSNVESLKSNLVQSQEKCSTAEKVIDKMKQTETELQNDLQNAKGIVLKLEDKFHAAK